MEKTIKVTGTGLIRIKPDTTKITLDLSAHYKEYADTIKASANDLAIVKNALEKIGFDKNNVKTKSFSIDPYYQYYSDNEGKSKRIMEGYEYEQSIYFTFKNDNELLGKALDELRMLNIYSNITITYFASNQEEEKNQLLENAVKDAINKGKVLALASGVEIEKIINIDYSFGRVVFETEEYNAVMGSPCCERAIDIDIEPDDIECKENVTITWSIK